MLALGGILGALLLNAPSARAQNQGFDINRYQPTPAGEWSFMVDHPWFSKTRFFAAGITLDYAHNPLLYATSDRSGQFSTTSSIVAHQLIGSLDLAGSFLDRVNIAVSIPLTLLESGDPAVGVAPIDGASIRDPSASLIVRLYGQPDESPFSISLGATVWLPLRSFVDSLPSTASDLDTRVLPKLVLGGLSHHVRWSFVGAFLYRPNARLSASFGPEGNVTDHSVQFGAAIAYATPHFAIGPEVRLNTIVTNGQAFGRNYTSLEALVGAHYNIVNQVQIGAAVGLGALREPGTPDVRALLRLAYAPIRSAGSKLADRDRDGIPDKVDACPDEAGPASADPAKNGCPPPPDRDRDGVIDAEDQCVELPQGPNPDPARKGCPLLDRDRDTVPDVKDACPDQPGAPHPDPKKNGCPSLVEVKDGKLVILKPVYFALDKDIILPESFPVLQAVANALKATPAIQKLRIEGHTDNQGNAAYNMELSNRRARSVMRWLTTRGGVALQRLDAQGYGLTRPIDTNATPEGQARNRRVEFTILAQTGG